MTRLNPLTAHLRHAGFSPGSDERIARSSKAGERAERRRIVEALRPVESQPRSGELPADFADPAVTRVAILMRQGNWEAAQAAIRCIASEWEVYQVEQSPLAELPRAARLATHVNRLGLPPRTVELLELQGVFTAGALLESFPAEFVHLRNFGLETAKGIGRALTRAGLLNHVEACLRIDQWRGLEDAPVASRRQLLPLGGE